MVLTRWILPALLLSPAVAAAQSEAALKNYFEGRSVTLKLAMPGTESEEAQALAERLRTAFAHLEFRVAEHVFHVTSSIGVAQISDAHHTEKDLMEEADQALYEAKRKRVAVAA